MRDQLLWKCNGKLFEEALLSSQSRWGFSCKQSLTKHFWNYVKGTVTVKTEWVFDLCKIVSTSSRPVEDLTRFQSKMGVMVFKVLDVRSSEKLNQKQVFFMILIQYVYEITISKIFVAFFTHLPWRHGPFQRRLRFEKLCMRKDESLQVKVVPGVTCNRENKFMTNNIGAAGDVC